MYKVLMLEDDRFRLYEYTEVLNENGFLVTATARVNEFLENISEEYDGYIIDINIYSEESIPYTNIDTMGGWKTGYVIAKSIREKMPFAYIAALTNSCFPEVRKYFSENDSVGYYNKLCYPPYEFAIALHSQMSKYIEGITVFFDTSTRDSVRLKEDLKDYRKYFEIQEFPDKHEILKRLDEIIDLMGKEKSQNITNKIFDFVQLVSGLLTIFSMRETVMELVKILQKYVCSLFL